MGTQGHGPPRLPPRPGHWALPGALSCLFSGWYVSSCVSLMIGSCAENNKNQIPLLLVWTTGTKRTWSRLFIQKATSASREEGGSGQREGGAAQEHHRGHQVGLEGDPGGCQPPPPALQGCGLNRAGGFRGPCLCGGLSTTAALESEVARQGDACVHTPHLTRRGSLGGRPRPLQPVSSRLLSLLSPSGPDSWIFLTSTHLLEPDPALL